MHPEIRHQVEWPTPEGIYRLYEPSPSELAPLAPLLATFYNEPHNRAMLTNTQDLSPGEVVQHFEEQWSAGGRPFLLTRDGALLGDADLRRFEGATAEFAILVGARAEQGRGLGRRFGLMAHALAFGPLGLERLYAAIIPANGPSRRLFEWLGYLPDHGPGARACADEEDDLTYSLSRADFLARHGAALSPLGIATRTPPRE